MATATASPRRKHAPPFEIEGNRLTPLVEGSERLEALLGLIAGAKRSLRLLYYIYADDATGRRVRDALVEAIGRGVKVSLIVDGFGSDRAPGQFFLPLDAAGATVCRFIPRYGRRYLLRNHQKLALADEARAIIGGFNISDDYFADRGAAAWRDLGLLVEGPQAKRLAGYYDALARWTHQPNAKMRTLRRALSRWSQARGKTRWLLGGPSQRLSPWARTVKQDISRARRIDIIAAYFSPNPAMLRRLERTAKHQDEARIVTAAKSDNDTTVGAARHCYASLLKRGVQVFEYQPSKLHTKLFVLDDVVHVGSANFDMRSLYLNLELMLRIDDAAFAAHMRGYFEGELEASDGISRAEHRANATLLRRIKWGLCYFAVTIVDYGVSRRLNFGAD